VRSDGLPAYYPTLFATSQLRNTSQAAGTVRQKLSALKVLTRWETAFNVDLVQRFKNQSPLKHRELISLRDFCSNDFRKLDNENNVISLFKSQLSVSNSVQYSRISVIAEYLEFLSLILSKNTGNKEL
jgi:hypothetical protein